MLEARTALSLSRGLAKQIGGDIGYRTFQDFKKAHGPAGQGLAWHHAVEQHRANIDKFGKEAVHSLPNIVALPSGIHNKISGYYSSKPAFAGGLTVREWLKEKPFDVQHQFGMTVIKERLQKQ